MDSAGNLYGTTFAGAGGQGGRNGLGTVFKLDPTGHETVLYSFTGLYGDGAHPFTGVIRDSAGTLYGTTREGGLSSSGCSGGSGGCGTVFVLMP